MWIIVSFILLIIILGALIFLIVKSSKEKYKTLGNIGENGIFLPLMRIRHRGGESTKYHGSRYNKQRKRNPSRR